VRDAEIDFEAVLKIFSEEAVDFLVIGGVCAVLHGAPVSTFDLDLIYSPRPDNLERLERTLTRLEACYREKRNVRPDAKRLANLGHHLLMTRLGPVDLLGRTGTGEGFEELISHTGSVDLGTGRAVRILDLPDLIRLKKALGRERDRAVLPILERTLREQSGEPPAG